MLLKSSFFIIYSTLMRKLPSALIVAWFESAVFCLFLAFLALVLFWADFYDYLENGAAVTFFKRSQVRLLLGCLFGILVLLISGFFVLLVLWRNETASLAKLQMFSEMIIAGMFLAAGLAYTVYGLRLASLLSRVRLASGSALKVALVASSITICFVTRSVLILYILWPIGFKANSFTLDFKISPLVEFLYCFVTEILPTFLMLFFLRKLPRWKESTVTYKTIQYAP